MTESRNTLHELKQQIATANLAMVKEITARLQQEADAYSSADYNELQRALSQRMITLSREIEVEGFNNN